MLQRAGESERFAGDYERVQSAIQFLTANWKTHPALEDVARHIGLSPYHFQKLFRRWAGISPKEFIQALTIDHARQLLNESANLLDASYELGLSGPARLHDLFVDYEAMTPGEFRRGGEGLEIAFGFHESPFGLALLMVTRRGVCGLAFADGDEDRESVFSDLAQRWPAANFKDTPNVTRRFAQRIFSPQMWRKDNPVKVVLIGTDFEIRVWDELLKVPIGTAVTYSDIASRICSPRAARAVGSAVGRNPVAFVVPCHRVIRKDGNLGGYHWGITRKKAIIGWEAGRMSALQNGPALSS